MSGNLSRRKLIQTGLGAVAGFGVLGAAVRIADRCGLIPANHRGIYGLSETLTYAGQRLLTKLPSMAREFDRSQISKVIPVNGRRRRRKLSTPADGRVRRLADYD